MPSSFVFCTCQPGAEVALKGEVAARLPEWRFAFSRPGFVTFRLPRETSPERFEPLRLTFARTMGVSLDRLSGSSDDLAGLAQQVWSHPEVLALLNDGPLGLHVWRRDEALPGEHGIEPGPGAESNAALEALRVAAPAGALLSDTLKKNLAEADGIESDDEPLEAATTDAAATPKRRTRLALDVALVEPNQWWIGAHALRSRTDRWPGGVPRLQLPGHAVSRAYLKLQEGLRWSAIPARKGDVWIELGCAPGGASQALLDAGMRVIGVDPAEVDPVVLAEPGFTHVRHRSAETPFQPLLGAQWLTADVNAAPSYTLNAVESIVTNESMRIRGLLLTIKLLNPELARPERVAEVIDWIRSWGYTDVRARQLAFNRREYCVAALPSRGQRRMKRKRAVRENRTSPPTTSDTTATT
ncbi:SAM-dependent methyltransferase [Botrimarina hoheduenensis]|uniref:Ribosomal RNA large subunit methyltransferase M n=1 Tax=Botrimarina hoheduenensis TaxID=2528000 RepID=A0A5C5VNR5_9BACT|nr:SAM-dependent methyltransferase [Botrimarina hoheduenensis]TWT40244.1 Ribosomal RNA large subunit methyltransferase M [Botrimarina hoheduenensis]